MVPLVTWKVTGAGEAKGFPAERTALSTSLALSQFPHSRINMLDGALGDESAMMPGGRDADHSPTLQLQLGAQPKVREALVDHEPLLGPPLISGLALPAEAFAAHLLRAREADV